MEKPWKLGQDVHPEDCLLDGFTFQQVIDALYASEKVVDAAAVRTVIERILAEQIEDMWSLVNKNVDEIIAHAKSGRLVVSSLREHGLGCFCSNKSEDEGYGHWLVLTPLRDMDGKPYYIAEHLADGTIALAGEQFSFYEGQEKEMERTISEAKKKVNDADVSFHFINERVKTGDSI